MKKYLSVILVLFYIVVSSGITMSFHYCMGGLADWEIGMIDTVCSSCGHKHGISSKCCSMETQFIKLALDQKDEHTQAIDFTPLILDLLPDWWGNHFISDTENRWTALLSPADEFRKSEVPIFIHHCLLLI